MTKTAYVCGPLTELSPERKESARRLYERIADCCKETLGVRAFVPHEHFDPIKHLSYTPKDVDEGERSRVCEQTSYLIVLAIEPSWGGGIEVEMAYRSNVPIILLCPKEKLDDRKICRLLLGNPGVIATIGFTDEDDAIKQLENELKLAKPH